MERKTTRVKKRDLIGQRLDRDTSIVSIDEETGELRLVHVEGFLPDGRHLLFNGEIKLPLKDFEWVEW